MIINVGRNINPNAQPFFSNDPLRMCITMILNVSMNTATNVGVSMTTNMGTIITLNVGNGMPTNVGISLQIWAVGQ